MRLARWFEIVEWDMECVMWATDRLLELGQCRWAGKAGVAGRLKGLWLVGKVSSFVQDGDAFRSCVWVSKRIRSASGRIKYPGGEVHSTRARPKKSPKLSDACLVSGWLESGLTRGRGGGDDAPPRSCTFPRGLV